MAEDSVPEGVTVTVAGDTASATTLVAAPPAEVFDFVRRPENHPLISGDESVKGNRVGPDVLGAGDRFGMDMKMYGLPYRITSQVQEFDDGRLIAWAHSGGHRWRWTVEADGDGSRVTETFDLSTAKPLVKQGLKLMGFPARHRDNVARSVANVRAHFAG